MVFMSEWSPVENMISGLEKSLQDILDEKLRHPKWRKKINNSDLSINFIITDKDYDTGKPIGKIYLVFDLEKERYDLGRGHVDNAHIGLSAPLGKFFEFSSWQMSLLITVLGKPFGGLKISGKRRIGKMLLTATLLRCLKEKELKDLEDE